MTGPRNRETRDDNAWEQDTPDAPLRRRIAELEARAAAVEEALQEWLTADPHTHDWLDFEERVRELLAAVPEENLKEPCLYPLPDGGRCLECEECQPVPEEKP